MTEEWEENPNEFVTDDGEILELPEGVGDRLAWAVLTRHELKLDTEWDKKEIGKLDSYIKSQLETKSVFGEVAAAVRRGTYDVSDCEAIANDMYEGEVSRWEMCQMLAASRGFTRDKVPQGLMPFYKAHTEVKPKTPWVETSRVRRAAPRRKAS